MIPFVDLKAQYEKYKSEFDAAIQSVVESRDFVQGKACTRFEENFAKASEQPIFISCSNGTTALELALRAYGIGPGDEVIVPSHTFIATAEVVNHIGAIPVFAEIDEATYTIDPARIEERITAKTKAIIPVHLYGQAADMDPIFAIAKKHNLAVIEDCAQAHLAEYKGKKLPVGDIGCFSFYPGKNLGAYGDAGGVMTKRDDLAQKMRAYADHGRAKGEKYSHSFLGMNYRMDSMQAAILDVKLKYLPEWTNHRRSVAQQYRDGLQTTDYVVPMEAPYAIHVYHLFVVRTPHRDATLKKLKENGVDCGIHYPIPLHLQPAYASFGYKKGDFPITEKIAEEILSLPICGETTDESIETVLSLL